MKTYLICNFKDDDNNKFSCIFEIEPEPFKVDSFPARTNYRGILTKEKI